MNSLQLKNAAIVTQDGMLENAVLTVCDGIIISIGQKLDDEFATVDLNGATVFPGFIDVHNHGAIGIDANDATAEEFLEVGRFLAKNGVTAWLPTFVPDSDENYRRQIAVLEEVRRIQVGEVAAQVVGVHFEGIFANQKMCGALRPQFFKTFSGNELDEIPQLRDAVHFTTYAPEIEGGIELTEELTRRGWIASIGHTMADIPTLDLAKAAGARHMTHFFNAMTGLHHRDVGVVGWGLSNEDVTFDIIADGIHVRPEILRIACQHKTPEKVTLISDSVSPAGLGDGDFEIWGEKVSVVGGRTKNERGSIAGSVITMLDAVRTMRSVGFSPSEVSLMASRNPAKLLGIEGDYGTIEVGKRADLVVLDEQGNVVFSIVGGNFDRNGSLS